jgi:hypothetical protein
MCGRFNISEICSSGNKVHVFIIHLHIHSSMALQPFVGLWPLLQFRYLFYTDGRTPWTSDQLVARPLPTHRTTKTQKNAHTDINASNTIRTHDHRVRENEDSSCLNGTVTVITIPASLSLGLKPIFFRSLYSPFGVWPPIFQFHDHFTDGRTPWTSDQLVAKPLPKHRITQTENKHIHIQNIHALYEIRIHDPGFRASEDSTCLRLCGYRNRRSPCSSHVTQCRLWTELRLYKSSITYY